MVKTEINQILSKKVLGLTFVLSAAAFAFAQEKVTISSTVVDRQNNPVPYASVTFNNKANGAFNDAALTDDKGFYTLQLVPGNYDVTVDAIDFKKSTVNKQITAAGNIGNITVEREGTGSVVSPVQEIEGVTLTVQATRAYRVEIDKKVYDPSLDIVSKGGNLQDVLSNVPSVTVDTDGTVSMRGNTNVRFLINGKPSSLLGIEDGANAMQSIPADQIERIEVITNPSSKFEASGTAGILNIILKKDRKMGFNGNVTGTLGYLPRTNLTANLNWRKGDWTWYLNGGGGYQENESSSNNITTRKDNIAALGAGAFPFTQYSNQRGLTERTSENYNLTAGFLHQLSDRTSVNFSGMLRSFNSDQNTLNTYEELIYSTATAFGNYNRERNSFGNNKNFANQLDLGLDHKIGDYGQLITVSGSYQNNKTDGFNQIVQNTYLNSLLQPTGNSLNNVNTVSKNTTFIGKADYELPIGETSKLEAGARYDYNKNTYDYFVNQSDDGSPLFTRYDFTSNTVYSENILGIYAQFKSKLGEKLGYQVGLRSETSAIDIDFTRYETLTGNSVQEPKVKKNYTQFFPSVFLSYELDKNNQLLLNYSRRINRPRAFSLIPFMSFDDDRNLFRGNPDLNPTYENSFELGYSLAKSKITFNPTLYYKQSQDEQNRYQYIDLNGAINTIPYNIGSETNYGLDLNATFDPFKWWKMMLSTDVYGYKNEGTFNLFPGNPTTLNDFSGDGFSYRVRFNNTIKPTKNLSLQLQSFYRAGEKTAMNDRKAMYGFDFGASQTIWDGNGTIAFNIRDIFNTRKMSYYSDTPQFTREVEMQWQPRQFSLSLTYRFKQGDKVDQLPRKKDINSNSSGDDEMQGPM